MSDRKNLENNETILLPKGTILHHYSTRKNKLHSFRWYYLASQKYTSTVRKQRHFCIYETNHDIILEKYHLCELVERDTREIIHKTGIYDSKNYIFPLIKYRQHIDIKNREQDGKVPRVTFENSITSNDFIEDPLRGLVVKYNDNIIEYETIEYEIILDNSLVTTIN